MARHMTLARKKNARALAEARAKLEKKLTAKR